MPPRQFVLLWYAFAVVNEISSFSVHQQRRCLRAPLSPHRELQCSSAVPGQGFAPYSTSTTGTSQVRPFVSRSLYATSDSSGAKDVSGGTKLDDILSTLTTGFPLFVLTAAVLALLRPSTLNWVNQGSIITTMVACVMCGTGLTLEAKDFTTVFKDNFQSVPLGVACQYIIMPLAAWLVGRTFLLSTSPELFLGLALVGCSPGGTASNLVSLIGKADVALSVILTACSTLLAVVMTPALVKLLVGSNVTVSGMALCEATARVVLLPVLAGMLLNAKLPKVARWFSRFTPFASVLLVSIVCGGVVAQNATVQLQQQTGVLSVIIPSVLLLHAIGFAAGYFIPKLGFKTTEKAARTISIEVGMQNSALAVVLARSIGAPALATLPGAISATVHSCLGSLLAAIWRLGNSDDSDSDATSNEEPEYAI